MRGVVGGQVPADQQWSGGAYVAIFTRCREDVIKVLVEWGVALWCTGAVGVPAVTDHDAE